MRTALVIDKQAFFVNKMADNLSDKSFLDKSRALNSMPPVVKSQVLIALGGRVRERGWTPDGGKSA